MAGLEFYRERFAESGWRIFASAFKGARARGQNRVGVEHVIASLLEERRDLFNGLLQSLTEQRALVMLRELIEERVEVAPKHEGEGVRISPETVKLFKRAFGLVRSNGRRRIEDTDLFIRLLMDEESLLREILRELIAQPQIEAQPVHNLVAVVRSLKAHGKVSDELPKYFAGEIVRLKTGPFAAFTGEIEKVDEESSKLNVRVFIMGRAQPVEIRFMDAEKINF